MQENDESSDLQTLMEIIGDMQKKHGQSLMGEEGEDCPECGKPYSEECAECPRAEKHGEEMNEVIPGKKKQKSLAMLSESEDDEDDSY